MNRNRILLPALSALLVITSACDRSRELAANLDRVAGYLDTSRAVVAASVAAGAISTDTGEEIVQDLQQINRLNGDLITTARGYVGPDGRLRLDGDGQAKLLAIVGSARAVVVGRLADPEFSKLTQAQRVEIERNLRQVEAILGLISETIRTAKLVREAK